MPPQLNDRYDLQLGRAEKGPLAVPVDPIAAALFLFLRRPLQSHRHRFRSPQEAEAAASHHATPDRRRYRSSPKHHSATVNPAAAASRSIARLIFSIARFSTCHIAMRDTPNRFATWS
jgi:hypothetical protein